MYKIHKDNFKSHFTAVEIKKKPRGLAKKSLIIQYNEAIPGLADVFHDAYVETLNVPLKGSTKQSWKEKQYKYILRKIYAFAGDDYLLEEYCELAIHRAKNNIWHRRKLFNRKASLNEWNYFVTFTYDDKKHTEESFRKSLKKCLSNLSTRRNWSIMGKFERAPETGRLHFHCVAYVPNGELIGTFFEEKYYSTKSHEMKVSNCNMFFNDRFGRSDFQPIDEITLKLTKAIEYVIKYIDKDQDEKIFYSRGIPSAIIAPLNLNADTVTAFYQFCEKFLLLDTILKRIPHSKQFIFLNKDIRLTHNTIRLVA